MYDDVIGEANFVKKCNILQINYSVQVIFSNLFDKQLPIFLNFW